MTYIHPTALIGENVEIGEDVYIGPYCVIGFPPEWRGREDDGIGVVIESGTRITGHVTIDSGVNFKTYIGKNCYLLKGAHVGHDAKLWDNITVSCKAIIGGHVVIYNDCNIGLGAIIHQNQIIAKGVMLGMGAIVTKTLRTEPFKTYVGNPARLLGENSKHPNYTIYMRDSL